MNMVCIISTVHNALDNRVFYREACSLYKAGYKVTLIAIHDKPETIQGIVIIPLRHIRRSRRPLQWINVLRIALKTRADIYHIHDPELLFISPIIRFFSGRPVIYDIHEATADFIKTKDDLPNVVRKFLSWTFCWLEPTMAHLQSGLIFADDQIAGAFIHVKCPKITLFNFPGSSFLQAAIQTTQNIRSRQPIVLYLGGLKRFRGVSLMLEAFQKVLVMVPQAQLLLVGPFEPASLEDVIRHEIYLRKMTKSITITGRVPFNQVGNYLSQASIGWIPWTPVPKNQKNIPTKLFEYQAYAVPVVCSDLMSIQPFIQNRKTGLLVKADDPAAHASAIIELLNDVSFANSLGKNGQTMVIERYNWTEMEKRLITFYKQLCLRYS